MPPLPHNWIDDRAEGIIKLQGLTFALACLPSAPAGSLELARRDLKDAIVDALQRAYKAGQS